MPFFVSHSSSANAAELQDFQLAGRFSVFLMVDKCTRPHHNIHIKTFILIEKIQGDYL